MSSQMPAHTKQCFSCNRLDQVREQVCKQHRHVRACSAAAGVPAALCNIGVAETAASDFSCCTFADCHLLANNTGPHHALLASCGLAGLASSLLCAVQTLQGRYVTSGMACTMPEGGLTGLGQEGNQYPHHLVVEVWSTRGDRSTPLSA